MKKKVISMVLAIIMVISILPLAILPIFAGVTGAGAKFELVEVVSGTYKLVFSAKSPDTIKMFNTIFSFDNTLIQPVRRNNYTTDVIPAAGDSTAAGNTIAFQVLALDSVDDPFAFVAEGWKISGNRTAFNYTVFHATEYVTSNGVYKSMFEFYFRIKTENLKTFDDIGAATFNFEYNGEPGNFVEIYAPGSGDTAGVMITSNTTGTYTWGASNQTTRPDSIDEVYNPYATPPVPSNSGTITTSAITQNSLTLNWTAATDNTTPATNLKYYVYQSSSNNIASVTACETNGSLLNTTGTTNITNYNIASLAANTAYYFNVVVEDKEGNRAAYTSVTATTLPPPPEYAISIATNNAAQNNVTAIGAITPTGNQTAGTNITVTITLAGTAIAAGTHTVGLTSASLGTGITSPSTVTRTVAAGESVTTGNTFAFSFTMPASAVTDLVVTHTFTEAVYPISIATNNVAQNGLTATGAITPTGNQTAGTNITVTITLTGTAIAAGTHTVGLTSATLTGITSPSTVTKTVAAGETVTTGNTFTFSFTMPASAVTNLVVTHTFSAEPAIAVTSTGLASLKVGQSVAGNIIYTLSNGVYATPINTADFAVFGLPIGLTSGTAVRTSDTVVTVPVTGTPTTADTNTTAIALPTNIPQANVISAAANIAPTGSVTVGAIAKGDQNAPGVPTMADSTPTSITLNTVTGQEYKLGTSGTWQDAGLFALLNPNTSYTFYTRLKATADGNYNASPDSAGATFTTPKAVLGGTVTITGTEKFNETLTADTTGLTTTPTGANTGMLSYQWKRGAVNIGTNSSTYKLVKEDIGQTITVSVTAANCTGTVTSVPTNTIDKADGPAAPTVTYSYTGNGTTFTCTINPITGAQYSKDGSSWQDSNIFTGFTTASPVTTFYARIKETDTHYAGASGSTAPVTFVKLSDRAAPALGASISGKKITIESVLGAEYKFADDVGATLQDWSSNNEYTFTNDAIFNLYIRLEENATHYASAEKNVQLDTSLPIPPAPAIALDYAVEVADASYTVTISADIGCEYSFDVDGVNSGWSTNNALTGCLPDKTVTGYKRVAEVPGVSNTGNIASANLTLPRFTVQKPTASPNGGTFTASQSVTLDCATAGADIYYTTDGTDPTTGSTLYTGAFALTDTTTIKAFAAKAGMIDSGIVEATFTFVVAPATYTVTFDPDGGTHTGGGALTQTVEQGKAATAPVLTRSGYTFNNWDIAFNNITADITVKAQWIYNPQPQPQDSGGNQSPPSSGGGSSTIVIVDATITPANAEFDKYGGEDISVKLDKGSYTLQSLTNGKYTLVLGTDYTVKDDVYTIKASYLNTLENGTRRITFAMDGGVSPRLTVKVTDTTPEPPPPEPNDVILLPFVDVTPDDWYYGAVAYVYDKGLMLGVAEDRFAPDSTLTRAMIVTILYRLEGEPDVSELPNPFDDVPEGEWYTDAIKWAADNGIVLGYGDGRFGLNDPVTKEQLAAIIYRKQQADGKTPMDILMDHEWSDWDAINDWAKPAVNALTMQGIFRDIPGSAYNPKAPATRAEIASMLYRYMEAIAEK